MRPGWTDYFLGIAFVVSVRSRDIHTKHGCLIVDRNNHILGVGYNSWPAGMDDDKIPNNRPINPNDPEEESKYDWVIHAEENAILNSGREIRGSGATAYITGQPCHHCAMLLAQKGVKRIVMADRKGTLKETSKSKRMFDQLIHDRNIDVQVITPNLRWIVQLAWQLVKMGFVEGVSNFMLVGPMRSFLPIEKDE